MNLDGTCPHCYYTARNPSVGLLSEHRFSLAERRTLDEGKALHRLCEGCGKPIAIIGLRNGSVACYVPDLLEIPHDDLWWVRKDGTKILATPRRAKSVFSRKSKQVLEKKFSELLSWGYTPTEAGKALRIPRRALATLKRKYRNDRS